jgi:hypothetical protein
MNQQEATRAEAVSWLRAGRTVKEIMSYGDFNKNTCWEKEIWPPSSPDCSSLDCLACGVFEWRVKAKPHNKTKNLIMKIRGVMVSFAWNRKPARGSGPRLRLSSLLLAVLLTKLILSKFLCQLLFTSMKSDGFQLCCVI